MELWQMDFGWREYTLTMDTCMQPYALQSLIIVIPCDIMWISAHDYPLHNTWHDQQQEFALTDLKSGGLWQTSTDMYTPLGNSATHECTQGDIQK